MALYGHFLYAEEVFEEVVPLMQDGDWVRIWSIEKSQFLWGVKIIKPEAAFPAHTYEDEVEPEYDPCKFCEFLALCNGPPCDYYTTEMTKHLKRQQEMKT